MPNHIVRFDPFEDLARIQREVNRLFDDSSRSGTRQGGAEAASTRTWAPAVDIFEDANEIVFRVELPGIKQDDIDIEVSNDTLTIKGERHFEDAERKDGFIRVERAYGKFQRSFSIPIPVDQDKIQASYRDGLLEVKLPKAEAIKPKKVQVTTS
jgi:HSP20 family protein